MRKRIPTIGFFLAICAGAAGPPQRIVSLSPTVTELLYGIGAFRQWLGLRITARIRRKSASYRAWGRWDGASLEKVSALRPDLVVVDDGEGALVEDTYRKLILRLLIVPLHNVRDVYRTMTQLARPPAIHRRLQNLPRPHATAWREFRKRQPGFRAPAWY